MTTTCDTDPNTQTIAAAWASSPLGQPEGEVPSGFATAGPTEPVTARADERSAKRVMVATGLVCGIGAGALLGVMLFTSSDSSQPAVVVPAPAPQHAVVVSSSTAAPTPLAAQPPVAIPPISTPPVASAGDTTVVVNIPIPDYPPLPPKPEDPDPNRRNRRSWTIRVSNNRNPRSQNRRPSCRTSRCLRSCRSRPSSSTRRLVHNGAIHTPKLLQCQYYPGWGRCHDRST